MDNGGQFDLHMFIHSGVGMLHQDGKVARTSLDQDDKVMFVTADSSAVEKMKILYQAKYKKKISLMYRTVSRDAGCWIQSQ